MLVEDPVTDSPVEGLNEERVAFQEQVVELDLQVRSLISTVHQEGSSRNTTACKPFA